MMAVSHIWLVAILEDAMTDRKPVQLRLPSDLKAWIAAQAEQNASSQNSEIVRAVRERMEREGMGYGILGSPSNAE